MSEQDAAPEAPPSEPDTPSVGESDHDVLVSMRDLLNELVELARQGGGE